MVISLSNFVGDALPENPDYGTGALGALVVNSPTLLELSGEKNHTTVQIDLGATVASTAAGNLILRATGPVTVNGILHADGRGGAASAGTDGGYLAGASPGAAAAPASGDGGGSTASGGGGQGGQGGSSGGGGGAGGVAQPGINRSTLLDAGGAGAIGTAATALDPAIRTASFLVPRTIVLGGGTELSNLTYGPGGAGGTGQRAGPGADRASFG